MGIEPIDPLDLRDDLVGAAGDVEAVDEIAAHHRGKVCADLLEVETERRGLVVIDHDLSLRLIDFCIDDWRESKLATLHRGRLQLLGEIEHLLRLGGRKDARTRPGNCPPPGRAGGINGNIWMPGIVLSFSWTLRHELKRRFLPLAPGLEHHAAEATRRKSELKSEIRFRETEEFLLCCVGKRGGLFDRCVSGRIDDAEDDALIFGRRQLAIHRDGELEEEKPEQAISRSRRRKPPGAPAGCDRACVHTTRGCDRRYD